MFGRSLLLVGFLLGACLDAAYADGTSRVTWKPSYSRILPGL